MTKSREAAIAAGVKVAETKHSMKRRSPWHDYRKKGTYMLTMVVEGRKPLLGRLVMPSGKPQRPGEKPPGTEAGTEARMPGTGVAVIAHVELTSLGKVICDEEILKIPKYYPMVEIWKLCVMPDHIHMIVRVKEDLPKGKNLGQVVWGFKAGCTKAWWRIDRPGEKPPGTRAEVTGTGTRATGTGAGALGTGAQQSGIEVATVPVGSSAGGRPSLFEPGYNDKILLREGQLEN